MHAIPLNAKAWAIREHYRIDRREELAPFYAACAAGRDAGCTFCSAILCDPVTEDDRVVVLSDFMAAWVGTVLAWPPTLPRHRPFEVLVQMDHSGAGSTTTVDQVAYLVHRLPAPSRPDWWPPFGVRDSSALHEAVLRVCAAPIAEESHWQAVKAFIAALWRMRLPVESDEATAMFAHHGMEEHRAQSTGELYRRGYSVIVFAVGRKPIMSKRADYVRRRRRSKGRGSHGNTGSL